jgi:Glycolipid 2-alpha-mannosyltransferase
MACDHNLYVQTIFILARNHEQYSLLETLQQFEATFNERWHYPYVIVNDEVFTDDFMNVVRKGEFLLATLQYCNVFLI